MSKHEPSRLDEIQARANDPFGTAAAGVSQVDKDRDYLLAVVHDRQAKLDRVASLLRTWEEVGGDQNVSINFVVSRARAAINWEGKSYKAAARDEARKAASSRWAGRA